MPSDRGGYELAGRSRHTAVDEVVGLPLNAVAGLGLLVHLVAKSALDLVHVGGLV
jgi:hypothetical protein